MKFDVLTIFPEMFSGYFGESIIKRAIKKKFLTIKVHDLRKWAAGKHKKVDDKPYGGGPGMVFKLEPIYRALRALKVPPHLNPPPQRGEENKKIIPPPRGGRKGGGDTRVVLTSARGKQFTSVDARRLAKYKRVVVICGRYEGVDERVAQHFVDEELSIGPYVLTGGELPAMVMIDSISRQVPGVLGKVESLEEVRGGGFPTYTRPEAFKKWGVPKVLLSGDHKKIEAWRKRHGK